MSCYAIYPEHRELEELIASWLSKKCKLETSRYFNEHLSRESPFVLCSFERLKFLMQHHAGCSHHVMNRVTQTGSNVTSMLHNATVTSNTRDIIPMAAEFDQRPLDLKLVFLGDSAVGKTALLRRFNTGLPPEEGQPVDAYTFTDSIQVDGKKYLVSCWEVGLWSKGYERLRLLSYPGTDIFLLCFDITNQASFNSIKYSWISEIRHHMPYTPFLIVGNKMDLRRKK